MLAQSTGTDSQGEKLVGSTSSLSAGDVIPDRYVVVFNDEKVSRPGRVANELAQELNFEVKHVYRNALKGFSARVSSGFDLSSALSTDSRVKLVAQDRVVEATAQTLPTGIDWVEADNSSTNAGNGGGAVDEDIAILDTGIAKHPDLNIAGGRNCVGRDSSDYSDGNGHGTHVAGTAAAKVTTEESSTWHRGRALGPFESSTTTARVGLPRSSAVSTGSPARTPSRSPT